MAQCVLRMGAGAMPKGEADSALMQHAIKTMLATPSFKQKAVEYQQPYKDSSNTKTENTIVEAVEELLKSKQKVKPKPKKKSEPKPKPVPKKKKQQQP